MNKKWREIFFQASMIFLGLSLLIPGIYHVLWLYPQDNLISANTTEGLNQIRALNAMMAAIGIMSLWCLRKPREKLVVLKGIALILAVVSVGRFYSLLVDGLSNTLYTTYLTIEILLIMILVYYIQLFSKSG